MSDFHDSLDAAVERAHAGGQDPRLTADYDAGRPCRDCGPGYRIGGDGCRHGDGYQPEVGETGVCRTCALPIWWETGEIGHRERIGWSDRITRGGDSLVCFKAVGYRHVPMGGREAAIYTAGFKAGQEDDAGLADLLGRGDADEDLIEVISKAIADAQMHSHVEYKRRVGLAGRRTMAQTILWRLREHASVTSPGSGDRS